MKAFTVDVRRNQLVKLFLGLAVLSFLFRALMGLINQAQILGISPQGFMEMFYALVVLSLALLCWDIRDRYLSR